MKPYILTSNCIEKRDDPTNLITLCESCHKEAHDGNFNTGLNITIQEQLKDIIQNLYSSVFCVQDIIIPLPVLHLELL